MALSYSYLFKCSRATFVLGVIIWCNVQFMILRQAPPRPSQEFEVEQAPSVSLSNSLDIRNLRKLSGDRAEDHLALKLSSGLQGRRIVHEDYATLKSFNYTPKISFWSLHMCSPAHGAYECEGNPECRLPQCVHPRKKTVSKFKSDYPSFLEQAVERRTMWQRILERMEHQLGQNSDRTVMVLVVNIGFAHLFANFHCSVRSSLSKDDFLWLQSKTIIIATDTYAAEYVGTELGWFTLTDTEFRIVSKWTNRKIMDIPAMAFGRGSHGSLNMILKFATTLDLGLLGYRVMIQDVDVVWKGNAFANLLRECPRDECDAIFIEEGRSWESSGMFSPSTDDVWLRSSDDWLPEVNTGMFLIIPNNPILEVFKTVAEGSHLQRWKGRDQPLINSVLYHKEFSNVRIRILSNDEFVPGKRLHKQQLLESPLNFSRIVAIHLSDTGSYLAKVERMKTLWLWVLESAFCSAEFASCQARSRCIEPLTKLYRNGMVPEFLDELDPYWIQLASSPEMA